MEIEIGVTCLLLLVLVLFATLDMAFGQLSDVGLRRLAAERGGEAAGSFLEEILENRARFRFTLSAMMQILLVGVVVLVTSLSLQWFPSTRFILIAFGVGVGLTLTFRQLIPRLLSFRNPEKTFLALLPLVGPFYRVFSFVAAPWSRSFPSAPQRRGGGDETPAADDAAEETGGGGDDIQALIDVGEREGIIEEEEGELIHSIIEFGETQAGEVMTPRTDVVALPLTATVREARDVILDSKYSRLPVYRDQIDNVEGIIYVRDLLQCWAEGREDETIEPLLRPAYFVPETKTVDELLEEMQKAHVQLALVIDEYGGLAGLVTVEDIIEEIVGEIEDEDI